jgi:Fe-S-cluster containining protein
MESNNTAPREIKEEAVVLPKTDHELIRELQDRIAKLEEMPLKIRSKFASYASQLTKDEGEDRAIKVPACIRTGMCCETILLLQSPRELREAYQEAMRESRRLPRMPGQQKSPIGSWEDIHLIYPMLAGKCRGKYRWPSGNLQFVYGPCKNLTTEKVKFMKDGLEHERTVAACSIHEDRPSLCSGYPDYGRFTPVQMGPDAKPRSHGYMKGCGYNADPNEGNSPEQFEARHLVSLEAHEV